MLQNIISLQKRVKYQNKKYEEKLTSIKKTDVFENGDFAIAKY